MIQNYLLKIYMCLKNMIRSKNCVGIYGRKYNLDALHIHKMTSGRMREMSQIIIKIYTTKKFLLRNSV